MKIKIPKFPDPKPYKEGEVTGYYLDYIDPATGQRKRPRFPGSRDFALHQATQIYNNLLNKYYRGGEHPTYSDITLTELVTMYLTSIKNRVAPSTYRRYDTYCTNFLNFMRENFPNTTHASQVRKIYVDELLNEQIEQGYRPKTVNNQIFIIKALFRLAVEEGFIKESKVARIKRFPDRHQARGI